MFTHGVTWKTIKWYHMGMLTCESEVVSGPFCLLEPDPWKAHQIGNWILNIRPRFYYL